MALVYVLLTKGGLDAAETWNSVRNANFALYALGFLAYYLSFPLRGYRWRRLLTNAAVGKRSGVPREPPDRPDAGVRTRIPGLGATTPARRLPSVLGCAEILYLSWFVNCLVPAKLGDAYRSYLLKKYSRVSFSATMGTVVAERILDLLVLCLLLGFSALTVVSRFGSGQASSTWLVMTLGAVLVCSIGAGLYIMRRHSSLIVRLLPIRLGEKYLSLRSGVIDSFQNVPGLAGLTVIVWLAEAAGLYFVTRALGVDVSIPVVVFVALAGSLLTSVPGLPGGLILVEGGMTGALALAMPVEQALAVALLYRTISYWSIVILGLPLYLISQKK
ncbi:MAG TPA: lysylphosphatidylglycerol synthase transmembrane domain-containing protein [Dehalococcoidia bacterium]|nr:lysylphosphatidylglycerol synthase transmembrane domain-containing protein [Dehalococcoidia bacterium]